MQQVVTSASGAEGIQFCCKMIRKALLLKAAFLASSVMWEDVFLCVLLGLYGRFRVLNRWCFGNAEQSEECLPSLLGIFCSFIWLLLGTRGS